MTDEKMSGSAFYPEISEIKLPAGIGIKTAASDGLPVSVYGVKIPTVSIDRKALSSLIFGLLSIFLFPVFPLSLAAVVSGFKSLKSPKRKFCAVGGVSLGIISLAVFVSLCVILSVFGREIFSSDTYMSFSDFLVKCFGDVSRFIYGIFNGGN